MKLALVLAAALGYLGLPHTGMGAYYHQYSMKRVAIYRNLKGWAPVPLDEGWPCLAAWPERRPDLLGYYALADLPGCGMVICHIVDVGGAIDQASLAGEAIEIDWATAQTCGWDGYQDGVRVWLLGRELEALRSLLAYVLPLDLLEGGGVEIERGRRDAAYR